MYNYAGIDQVAIMLKGSIY